LTAVRGPREYSVCIATDVRGKMRAMPGSKQ